MIVLQDFSFGNFRVQRQCFPKDEGYLWGEC